MTSDPRTVPAALDRFARQFPDHDALITEDRSFTATALRDEVHRAAAALITLGVEPGRPGGHLVAEHLALGGGLPGHPPRRRCDGAAEHALHRRRSRRHPGSHRCAGAVRGGPVPGRRPGGGPGPRRPACAAPHRPDSDRRGRRNLGRLHRQRLRSCSTRRGTRPGRRRRSRRRQRHSVHVRNHRPQQRRAVRAPAVAVGIGVVGRQRQNTSEDRYLCINPFFHNFGYKAGILACLQTGATLIPHLTFDPLRTLQAIEQHRITVLPGPPTIYQTLLDHPARGDYDLSSLRFAVTGAATVPVVLVERMQAELDIDIVLTAYGLTEANGMGTMCRAEDDAVTVATTCGRPFADFELRIDTTGGESGRCCCAGRT